MKDLNKVLEDWIDGKIRTVMSPHWTASVKHKDQIHKLEEDSHFAFCDIQRIETRLDRLVETRLDRLETSLFSIKAQLNKTAGPSNAVVTNNNFWDCECESNYIHTKSTRLCSHCNAESDEQPDSHQSEVEALVYLKK